MKSLRKLILRIAVISFAAVSLCGAAETAVKEQTAGGKLSDQNLNVKVVTFKTCVEGSKLGKQEQASFEALKKQMESVLESKEKVLNEMAQKFEDPDYLDSLSPEAETELKRKFRALNQEYTTVQNQYVQTLSQTNMKVVQNITEVLTKATAVVAKRHNISLVLNDESAFFISPDLDISAQVIAVMDEMFEQDAKETKIAK
jgi:outer membrane protein